MSSPEKSNNSSDTPEVPDDESFEYTEDIEEPITDDRYAESKKSYDRKLYFTIKEEEQSVTKTKKVNQKRADKTVKELSRHDEKRRNKLTQEQMCKQCREQVIFDKNQRVVIMSKEEIDETVKRLSLIPEKKYDLVFEKSNISSKKTTYSQKKLAELSSPKIKSFGLEEYVEEKEDALRHNSGDLKKKNSKLSSTHYPECTFIPKIDKYSNILYSSNNYYTSNTVDNDENKDNKKDDNNTGVNISNYKSDSHSPLRSSSEDKEYPISTSDLYRRSSSNVTDNNTNNNPNNNVYNNTSNNNNRNNAEDDNKVALQATLRLYQEAKKRKERKEDYSTMVPNGYSFQVFFFL
jgi:hypothetical protein